MLWQNLDNKVIGIWGQGKEGLAASQAIAKHCSGFEIVNINEDNTADIAKCQVLIKSPGVSLYRDEIKKAVENGIVVTSGTNLFFANKPDKLKVIAVTGTKGKSTTSALLYHTLQELGKKVELGGNIGRPLVDLVDSDADWAVAEMSSYQCADCQGSADIGILLNLYPEHLQWHGSHQRYWADKLHMITQAKTKLLNFKDKRIMEMTKGVAAEWFNNDNGIHLQNGSFYDGEQRLFAKDVLPLLGDHNAENACAVLSAIKLTGENLRECEEAFKSFKALPHRLTIVAEKDERTFVDDSISTTPETAIAALKALDKGQQLILIAGGFDRGHDYKELAEYLAQLGERVSLITLPDTGVRLGQAAKIKGVLVINAADMDEAVAEAWKMSKKSGWIILSPAAPSYNMYKNFEARGEDFVNCIKKLAK